MYHEPMSKKQIKTVDSLQNQVLVDLGLEKKPEKRPINTSDTLQFGSNFYGNIGINGFSVDTNQDK